MGNPVKIIEERKIQINDIWAESSGDIMIVYTINGTKKTNSFKDFLQTVFDAIESLSNEEIFRNNKC